MLNFDASALGRWALPAVAASLFFLGTPASAEWNEPWKDESRALVIDAYEFNPIDWSEMTSDERIAGFISKASDGLPPDWSCRGLSGDDERLCKNRWWKYSVTQELYFTRREMAKMLGLEWGAYHLGRPGNPREQADHFIDFAKPEADELVALDIEDNDPEAWMSLEDAEIFADQIRVRLGRYPVLYTNGNTAEHISRNAERYPILSRMPLWYARYRDDITGRFPEETWPSYALWQFASMHNCNARSCPYRIKGAKTDIDVNVSPLTVAELREAWPFAELVGDAPPPAPLPSEEMLVAGRAGESAASAIEHILVPGEGEANHSDEPPLTVAAYGPAETGRRNLDALDRLTASAREAHREAGRSPILSQLTASAPRHDPDMPADSEHRRPVPMRTHDVSAGILDAAGQLEGEMARVRTILRPLGAPADRPAAPRTLPAAFAPEASLEDAGRSRIAERLREAMRNQTLPRERERSDVPADQRSSLETGGLKGAWARISERVSSAFSATQ